MAFRDRHGQYAFLFLIPVEKEQRIKEMEASLLSATPVVARVLVCSCGLDISVHLTFLSISFSAIFTRRALTKRNRREQLTLSPQACLDLQPLMQRTLNLPQIVNFLTHRLRGEVIIVAPEWLQAMFYRPL